jgi:hypothetical protein
MDKIYMVRSYFEDYESSRWQIIGLYTDKKVAEETAKKWESFYEEKKYSVFNKPKDWKPTGDDLEFSEGEWEESLEYSNRVAEYGDLVDFREIEIEEYDLNKDMSLNKNFISEGLLSLMTQWDRNHKLEKIIK